MTKTAHDLQSRLLALIRRGVDIPTTDAEFDRLAREVFAFQFERNAVYRAYCESQLLAPGTVAHWTEIPAVPTSAFKEFDLACFLVAEAVAEFHTSGTTHGKPGRHFFKTLELYDAAITPNFAAHLLPEIGADFSARTAAVPAASSTTVPVREQTQATRRDAAVTRSRDGCGTLQMILLTPPPTDAPHSSLVHMLEVVAREFGARGVYCTPATALVELERVREPVLLLGTAFAFVHLFEECESRGRKFHLPAGSRAMEMGGFKGRSREMAKRDLYAMFERYLSVPTERVVNEYGMTELSTQFYDTTLRTGHCTDVKRVPPWARVTVIDPHRGKECALHELGLIRVLDLANLWTTMCVQTEDLGVAVESGFEIRGRATGAEARGCSLTAEQLRPR